MFNNEVFTSCIVNCITRFYNSRCSSSIKITTICFSICFPTGIIDCIYYSFNSSDTILSWNTRFTISYCWSCTKVNIKCYFTICTNASSCIITTCEVQAFIKFNCLVSSCSTIICCFISQWDLFSCFITIESHFISCIMISCIFFRCYRDWVISIWCVCSTRFCTTIINCYCFTSCVFNSITRYGYLIFSTYITSSFTICYRNISNVCIACYSFLNYTLSRSCSCSCRVNMNSISSYSATIRISGYCRCSYCSSTRTSHNYFAV